MRFVLLSSTTYGTWLPGSPRGSVTSVRNYRPTDLPTTVRIEHDRPGEPWEGPIPGLYASAQALLKQPPVYFTTAQARVVIDKFAETSRFRGRRFLAMSVMRNHLHAVVGFEEYIDFDRLLNDYKSYASRGLNALAGARQLWWTRDGSHRLLPDDRAYANAVHYVLFKQHKPLARWRETTGYLLPAETA
jgi:REP element-mobilizing transposase RayT